MKKYFIYCTLFLVMILVSFTFLERPKGDLLLKPLEMEAIKSVIEQETEAYSKRDSNLLFSFYNDDDITQSTWNSPNGSYGNYRGFKEIRKAFTKEFKENPGPIFLSSIKRSDWFFKSFSSDWVWVNFRQSVTNKDNKEVTSYETRIMKKDKGSWKITVMNSLSDHGIKS